MQINLVLVGAKRERETEWGCVWKRGIKEEEKGMVGKLGYICDELNPNLSQLQRSNKDSPIHL